MIKIHSSQMIGMIEHKFQILQQLNQNNGIKVYKESTNLH